MRREKGKIEGRKKDNKKREKNANKSGKIQVGGFWGRKRGGSRSGDSLWKGKVIISQERARIAVYNGEYHILQF